MNLFENREQVEELFLILQASFPVIPCSDEELTIEEVLKKLSMTNLEESEKVTIAQNLLEKPQLIAELAALIKAKTDQIEDTEE